MRMRLCTSALLALSGLVLMTGCDDGDDDTGDAGMEDDGGNGGDGGGTNGDGVSCPPSCDNDDGFDEEGWFSEGSGNEVLDDPPFTVEQCLDPAGPTEDVLDSDMGAFSGNADDWNWDSLWVNWDTDASGSEDGEVEAGDCDLSGEGKDVETIPSPTGDLTLTSDKVWKLEGNTYVEDGETLTIEPCTRIEGTANPQGSLIVSRGGQIMAEGTADEPILFTSALENDDRQAGDWGGVILLGKAQNFKGEDTRIEGLEGADPRNQYGGDEDDDNSGTMAYVRIEFGGTELMQGSEINGLTLGSVGSGTTIHHVMVSTTLDDCFEWFGGTVDADHLICNAVGDDMFDADQGYRGALSYLFGRAIGGIVTSGDPNGFEMDSDSAGELEPGTDLTVAHATLCGAGETLDQGVSFGMVLRENLMGAITDIAITGFDFGVDVRDSFGDVDDPNVELTDAKLWGMQVEPVRGPEMGTAED